MIIFDLDGTLADCEHRRHFVDPRKDPNYIDRLPWKPNWKAFYEACDQDERIEPVVNILCSLIKNYEIQIWSGRCESVREKTECWLLNNIFLNGFPYDITIKMRPVGDYTPDDQLKERWLEETYEETKWGRRSPIEMVFDDRPKVVKMWRDHGIFVFDCNQTGKEF